MSSLELAIIIVRNLLIVVILLSVTPLLVWLERKGAAVIQDRPGPERASIGPFRLFGLLHLVADAIKMIGKEGIIPSQVNKFYYFLGPAIMVAVVFLTVAIVPFFDTLALPGGLAIGGQMLNLDVGILWFFAIVSLTVYGVIFAGWSSASKFSLLGAMRASAAVLSYEIPMALAAISMVMTYNSVNLLKMVQAQGGEWFGVLPAWGLFIQPLAGLIFLICAFAETNRAPFELAEAESELVAGYHTEYSGLAFAMFMLGEYVAMFISSALFVSLFLGGWQVPWLTTGELVASAGVLTMWTCGILFGLSLVLAVVLLSSFQANFGRWKDMRDYENLILAVLILGAGFTALVGLFVVAAVDLPVWYGPVFAAIAQFGIFMAKVLFMCWVFVWVRWTLPKFRYDQLMNLGWRSLLPLALANILVTGVVITVLNR